MEPMTDLIVAQSVQRAIADLDLTDKMGREACGNLASKLENLLWGIKRAEWKAEDAAWEAREAAQGTPDKFPPFSSLDIIKDIFKPQAR